MVAGTSAARIAASRRSKRSCAAAYGGDLNASILWNSNFFMTPESMKILRILTDVVVD
jgi:hypothetical protein